MDAVTRRLVLSFGAGALGWCGLYGCLPLALGSMLAWRSAAERSDAFGAAALYYAGAMMLPTVAVTRYFAETGYSPVVGPLLMVLLCLVLAVPYGLLWSASVRHEVQPRFIRGAVLGLVLLLPPLGMLGVAHPWVGGASLFPGLGWFGFVLVGGLVLVPGRQSWATGAVVVAAGVVALVAAEPVHADVAFEGVSTEAVEPMDPAEEFARARAASTRAASSEGRALLLPEGHAGLWTETKSTLWELEAEDAGAVLVVGSYEEDGSHLRNGVAVVGDGPSWFWPQRIPAPVGMWAPWRDDSVEAVLSSEPVRDVAGERVGLLVCFEQFVPWPVVELAVWRPSVVLAPADLWFAGGSNVDAIRGVTMRSWGRLMGWTVVEAVNG